MISYFLKEVLFTIYEQILAEHERLEEQLISLKEQLSKLPEGKLICAKNDTRYKWYQSDGHIRTYISKKNRKLAEQLAVRKYLTHQFNRILHEKNALDFYLRHHDPSPSQADSLLSENSPYRELLTPYFKPDNQDLIDWQNAPYLRNSKYPEQLTNLSVSGNLVRSKSEVLIDMMLYNHKIPFRYECALELGAITIFPDFTMRHPHTGEIFYWEHFGLMDDPNYCKNVFSKLELYTSHGIVPSLQLITTYETKKNPLSIQTVEKLVTEYFKI